jgi:hypothetical protein
MPLRSEHDLSETENSPDPSNRRTRFSRGVFNDITFHTPRTREGLSQVSAAIKSWSSKFVGLLNSFDWKGNGRLVTSPKAVLIHSYYQPLEEHYN